MVSPHENNHNWRGVRGMPTSEMAEESSAAAALATWRAKSKSPTCAWRMRKGEPSWEFHDNLVAIMGSRAISLWLSRKILEVN